MTRLEHLRETLTKRLGELEARQRKVTSQLRKPGHPDWSERAVEQENDEVLEDLDERDRGEISRVQQALRRIDEGDYGVCEACGEPIAVERLAAVPEAVRCRDCAA